MVKKDKEIKVSFSVKKNGKYYAKEELSLNEFEGLLDMFIPKQVERKYNIFEKVMGKPKRDRIEKETIDILFEQYKFFLIEYIKQTMEYDGPGKKVLKKNKK